MKVVGFQPAAHCKFSGRQSRQSYVLCGSTVRRGALSYFHNTRARRSGRAYGNERFLQI